MSCQTSNLMLIQKVFNPLERRQHIRKAICLITSQYSSLTAYEVPNRVIKHYLNEFDDLAIDWVEVIEQDLSLKEIVEAFIKCVTHDVHELLELGQL